ncbi:cytochrome P450 [Gloeopeniophorella convolvens]|nr:cytochrome P450 [Gloeopeniophorella convolvens]
MLVTLFKLATCIALALAGATLFVRLRHRLRQRCLWKVPGPSNPSFVWGNLRQMFNPLAYSWHDGLFRTYGRVACVYGLFGDLQLVISDPKACSNILVRDQYIFEETDAFLNTNKQAFGPNLFSTVGAHHRKQRKILNPVFHINHMRHMIPTFHNVTHQLHGILKSMAEDGPQEVNIVEWMSRLALELVGQAGLGYNFGTLDGRNDEYCRAVGEWFPTMSSLIVPRNLFPYAYKAFPAWFLKIAGRMLPWERLNHVMDIAEMMTTNATRIYETKKRLLEEGDDATVKQVSEGRDIISLLIQANSAASDKDRLSEEEVIAQMSILLLAATDTTSSALSRILHILALHPEAQDKLRNELREASEENENLPYDQLVSLPYLDAVCRETLRLYISSLFCGLPRDRTRGVAVLPLSTPIHDTEGREIHELLIPDDTNVYIQISNLNRDPLVWGPDAAEWKPGRWLSPLPESVAEAKIQGVYSNTMTFIGGGRSCIGFKFSQLEMKVVLSQLIRTFRFEPSKQEVTWRFGNIVSPSVKGSETEVLHPNLPIIMSLA